ncbi:MAG TPA: DUF2490 domain-containing protein [Croceibacterium sp.]|nr:DUF2490 domain-containing protein [Croceibacterium sp.]
MNRTTGFSASLAMLAAASAATPARAANEDVQLWLSESLAAPLAPGIVGTFEVSQRFREAGSQVLTRGAADVRLSPVAVVGGGVTYVSTFDARDEFRPHQQLTLSYGPIALRTRVEERFFEGADRMELRLRQRIAATVPLAERLRAAATGELLYVARSQSERTGAHVDSWRGGVTLTRSLTPALDGTAGYLAIFAPRQGSPDRLSHVAQLTVTLRR